jgi:hypothetical protein
MPQGQPRAPVKKIAVFSGMVIGTAFAGLLFGSATVLIVALALPPDDMGSLGVAIVGVVISYPIGVIIGLLLVGRLFHYRGSLWLGAVGSILGGALGGALLIGPWYSFGLWYSSLSPGLEYISFLVLPPLLGTIGFRLKRISREALTE